MPEGQFRLRICYCKRGRLCFLSHLELVHALERVIRRSGLPFAISQGFNPHMKLAFGSALGVGTGSEDEYLEVWLNKLVRPDDALAALRSAEVEDLHINRCFYADDKAPSLDTELNVSSYEAIIRVLDCDGGALAKVESALDSLYEAGAFEVVKKGKAKTVNLAAHTVSRASVEALAENTLSLKLVLRSLAEGNLRPELFISEVSRLANARIVVLSLVRLAQYAEDEDGLHRIPREAQ